MAKLHDKSTGLLTEKVAPNPVKCGIKFVSQTQIIDNTGIGKWDSIIGFCPRSRCHHFTARFLPTMPITLCSSTAPVKIDTGALDMLTLTS